MHHIHTNKMLVWFAATAIGIMKQSDVATIAYDMA